MEKIKIKTAFAKVPKDYYLLCSLNQNASFLGREKGFQKFCVMSPLKEIGKNGKRQYTILTNIKMLKLGEDALM